MVTAWKLCKLNHRNRALTDHSSQVKTHQSILRPHAKKTTTQCLICGPPALGKTQSYGYAHRSAAFSPKSSKAKRTAATRSKHPAPQTSKRIKTESADAEMVIVVGRSKRNRTIVNYALLWRLNSCEEEKDVWVIEVANFFVVATQQELLLLCSQLYPKLITMNVDKLPKLQEQDAMNKPKEHPCKRIAIEAYMCKGQNHIAYKFGICNELFDKVKECLAEDERNNPASAQITSTRSSRQ